MQDTDRYQLELINIIFGEEAVVQKFGDANQAIYNNRDDSFEPVWNPQADFQITSSRRISRSIARLTQSLGVTPQVINGNPLRPDRNHTIICFNAQQSLNVIPVYATLIEEEGLSNGKFMALGAVAKVHQQHLTIQNYWPGFERATTGSRNWQQQTSGKIWH